jgi:hypothetical protein
MTEEKSFEVVSLCCITVPTYTVDLSDLVNVAISVLGVPDGTVTEMLFPDILPVKSVDNAGLSAFKNAKDNIWFWEDFTGDGGC